MRVGACPSVGLLVVIYGGFFLFFLRWRFWEKRQPRILVARYSSCSVMREHEESSRMAFSTWVCMRSFVTYVRCRRMSKLFFASLFGFWGILRPALMLECYSRFV